MQDKYLKEKILTILTWIIGILFFVWIVINYITLPKDLTIGIWIMIWCICFIITIGILNEAIMEEAFL